MPRFPPFNPILYIAYSICLTWLNTYKYTPYHNCFNLGRVMCATHLMVFRELVFISHFFPLLSGLESTPKGSLQEQKHCFAASEPRQYHDEVACFTSLRRKPFSSFNLYLFIFNGNVHWHFLFSTSGKRDPKCLE